MKQNPSELVRNTKKQLQERFDYWMKNLLNSPIDVKDLNVFKYIHGGINKDDKFVFQTILKNYNDTKSNFNEYELYGIYHELYKNNLWYQYEKDNIKFKIHFHLDSEYVFATIVFDTLSDLSNFADKYPFRLEIRKNDMNNIINRKKSLEEIIQIFKYI